MLAARDALDATWRELGDRIPWDLRDRIGEISKTVDAAWRFRRIDAGGFELLLDLGGQSLPEELVLELRGRRRRIAAFWNGQAWVG